MKSNAPDTAPLGEPETTRSGSEYPWGTPAESRRTASAFLGLRVLILEDMAPDVELIEESLRDAGFGFSFVAVSSRAAYEDELVNRMPDLLLCDFTLPGFDGRQSLEIAKRLAPDVPFIFVTGVLGEEVAIELLKQGATDCVLKTHLTRLAPSVSRALREAQERRDRKRAEEKLRGSHEQLRALTSHLHTVREEERARIARQVHDELGQALTGLKLDLAWIAGRVRTMRGVKEKVKEMSARVDDTINTVRRIATDLRPGVLDSLGLVAAVEWQAHDFQERTGIHCELAMDVRENRVDAFLSTVCFRIFQETLTNIIRHAMATRVEVRLAESEGRLVLTVRDNGRGISEREINARAIGLVGMKERATQVGGDLYFFGVLSQGTTVTLRVPLSVPPVGEKGEGAP